MAQTAGPILPARSAPTRMAAAHIAAIAACCLLPAPLPASAQVAGYRLDPVHTRVMFELSHDGYSQAIGTVSGSEGQIAFDPQDWSSARLLVTVPLQRLDMGDAGWTQAVTGGRFLDVDEYPVARFVSDHVEPITDDTMAATPAMEASAANSGSGATATNVPPDADARSAAEASHESAAAERLRPGEPVERTEASLPTPAPGTAQAPGAVSSDDNTAPHRARICGQLELHGVTRPLCLQVTFNKLRHYPLPPFRTTAGFSATATLRRSDFGIDAWQSLVGDEVRLRIEAEAVRDGDVLQAIDANRPPIEEPAAPDTAIPPAPRSPAP